MYISINKSYLYINWNALTAEIFCNHFSRRWDSDVFENNRKLKLFYQFAE